MQFSLRTSFFFCAVNPVGMSPADESRIVLMELLMHDNDRATARHISEEEIFFRDQGPRWCRYVVSLAVLISPSIETLERVMPNGDRRHRQNMSTLIAGAFVALNGRSPSEDEARALAEQFAPTVEIHAEALDRDDAQECLDYLFSHVVERYPLGHWLGVVYERTDADAGDGYDHHAIDAVRITRTFGFLVRPAGNEPGLFIRNGSPAIDKVLINTKWADRAWMRALRKLEDAFIPAHPVYFGGTGEGRGNKARAIGLALDRIPEPYDTPSEDGDLAARREDRY
jgi:hypothetical protein